MITSGQLWLMICTFMYGYFIDHAPNGGFQGPIQTNCKQTI